MMAESDPRIVDLLNGEAEETWSTAFGKTGRVYADERIEAVWVSKEREQIDPAWFSQDTVDLLVLLQGQLRVEFAEESHPGSIMSPGQMLILPAGGKCRAYRWPRESETPAVFLAVYPSASTERHS
ncbi:MAG: hypothetical protein WBW04_18735 [Nitrolancea sp.]